MRILKRNLAFMLAMIMALSLTAFAGYEDYPDVDELTYVEAVDVLTELGIVEGSNGQLLPTGDLTRAQAAKLIAYTMLGKKSADALQADTATFADVPTYHWAAGYVEYCANEGIVGGMGDGTFAPEAKVTASQLAKMLLCAVGYGQNGEFTGVTWDATVNAMATKLGVFDGNLDVVFADAATREEAFLYVFNTLTKVMKVTYSADADDYYAGTVFNPIKKFDKDETLGAKLYNLNTKTGEDDFGREGYFWTKNGKKITGLYGKDADAVYTTRVKSGTIYADLELDEKTMATVVHNGTDVFEFQLKKASKTYLSKNTTEICGNGVLVEAYVYGDDVKLIVIDTYLAKVTEKTEDDEVVVDVYLADGTIDEDVVFETSDIYAKGDYVLVTMIDGKVITMMPAATVEGKLTKDATSYVEIDETKINNAKNLSKHADVYEKTHNVDMIALVDEYGYLMGLVEAEGADLTEGYVLVLDSEFDDKLNENARVKVMFMETGDIEVLSMPTRYTKSDNEFKGPRGKWVGLGDRYEVTGRNDIVWTTTVTEEEPVADGFYGYYMTEDEEIVLVDLADTKAKETFIWAAAGDNNIVTDGKTQALEFGAHTDIVMNSNTVMNLVSTAGVETATGHKEIKINEDNVDALMVYSGVTAKEIFVVDGTLVGEEIVAYWSGSMSDVYHDADGTEIKLYHDGEYKWYDLSDDELTTLAAVQNAIKAIELGNNEFVAGVYKLTVEGTNDLVGMNCVAYASNKLEVEDTEEAYFEATTGTKYYYADPAYIYDVDADGEEATIREHDYVVVVTKTAGTRTLVEYAFIIGSVDKTEGNDPAKDEYKAARFNDGTTTYAVLYGKKLTKDVQLVVEKKNGDTWGTHQVIDTVAYDDVYNNCYYVDVDALTLGAGANYRFVYNVEGMDNMIVMFNGTAFVLAK